MALEKAEDWERKLADQHAFGLAMFIEEEDVKRLTRDFGNKGIRVLKVMLIYPKEQWKELGVPEYMMKYDIKKVTDEEDEEED